jgi:glycosyltransferase involved in cell wall biosynthesis
MTGRLRILSLIPYKVLPAQLGGEKGIAVFNEYLSNQVALTAISTKNNDPQLAKGYTLINILSNSRVRYINLFLYFTIRKWIRKSAADYLLIEHPYFGWLAWLIKKTSGARVVVHSHNMEYMRSRSIGRWWWKALMWYEAWVYGFADKVFFISEDDRQHAIERLNVKPGTCIAVTYGIEQKRRPEDKEHARSVICQRHGIAEGTTLLLFNGALYHSTNYEALRVILEEVNPKLLQTAASRYKIIVCGKGLPDFFDELEGYKEKNIIYAGFVDDINLYFKAADIFLNPILSGGGVKTKAIEALAYDCKVVSTPLGALGINEKVCGSMLNIVEEGNWKEFARKIVELSSLASHTPGEFYDYYHWTHIINRAVEHLRR